MIDSPYKLSEAESAIVGAACSPPRLVSADLWLEDSFVDLRKNIKTHYIRVQRTVCCYCKINLRSSNHRIWDVDHIASRKDHPHFMFIPENLAASCVDCNIAKSDTRTLFNKTLKRYPKKADAFKIIHPHFDNYSDHIHVEGMVYLPKTSKGKFTIYTCDLLRYAQKYIDWSNSLSDQRFESEVERVFSNTPVSLNAVSEIVNKLKVD